ncbi:FAD-dependent oxidoreductase [Pelomonas sp. Root1217]|uniref:NAD(P)/FAD-dependent oxidoreductase n=1 Tax=Pelomonas sp. Root1217 TaxID=1736430 RepID=UPI0007098872|nr:FAD-binding oxidoreductase [Pelomonas sp. Root1217]KQV48565.1 FAD-dependent oxidoreductase [Pelomonas sp. Root1217]
MRTFYADTADATLRFAPLAVATEADTVIIGGGFAGLGTALSLVEHGQRDCLLLEAQTLGFGASGRNGGFVSGGFSLDAARLHRRLGHEGARRLYLMSEAAVKQIRSRIERYRIDCDPVYGGVIVASWFKDDSSLRELQALMRDQFGLHWQWLDRSAMREQLRTQRYHAGLHELDAFHFNPLKYAQGKARVLAAAGVALHEHSRVVAVRRDGAGWQVSTGRASVRCRQVAICAGAYIDGLYPALGRNTLPIATYVMATEPLGDHLRDAICTTAAVFDTRFAFDYYRALPDTRLLWGGRMSTRERSSTDVARLLHGDLVRVYPQLRDAHVTHAWSGLMSYTRHQMPLIGRFPDGVWYAIGFGGHGVAPTTLGGEVLARAMAGVEPVPAGFAAYGREPTFGRLGLAAAQCTYWGLQTRDALMSWRDALRA